MAPLFLMGIHTNSPPHRNISCCLLNKNITLLSQHRSEERVGVANSCYLLQTFDKMHIKLALQLSS